MLDDSVVISHVHRRVNIITFIYIREITKYCHLHFLFSISSLLLWLLFFLIHEIMGQSMYRHDLDVSTKTLTISLMIFINLRNKKDKKKMFP